MSCTVAAAAALVGGGGLLVAFALENMLYAGLAIGGIVVTWAAGLWWANRPAVIAASRIYHDFQRRFPNIVLKLETLRP